ncbi:MAG: response regulator [Candidatus Sericytochromatia bacterium]|nr:response regulator [Candidatus Sericytochromatia bacterium]
MAKILAIDDEASILDLVQAFLENDDHEVILAHNGQDGVSQAQRFLPDLIICDVQMPDLTGYEVLQQVRAHEDLLRVPFVFLTGLDDMKHLRQGMNLGADDYLTKPFTYKDLSEAVRVRIEKHRTLTEQYENELKAADDKLTQARYFDAITNLPNREKLRDSFSAQQTDTAVFSCSFDGFAALRSERPEALLNALLKGAANRLLKLMPEQVFYPEANHFVLLLPAESGNLTLQAQQVLACLNDPYKIMQKEWHLTASLGIAQSPADGHELTDLLKAASSARQRAEAAGGNQHAFYD